MRKCHIQSAKNAVNTAANRSVVEQRGALLNNRRDTPLSGKEKGDTVLLMPPHRKVKGIVRAVPSPAYSIQWESFAAKSALKYQPHR